MQTTTANPTTMEITLKNVKTFRGREGHGLNADVYVNGIKTCFVMDEAAGGIYRYQPYNKEAYDKLQEYIKTLPERESNGFKFQPDLDTLVDDAFNLLERERALTLLTTTKSEKLNKHIVSRSAHTEEEGEPYCHNCGEDKDLKYNEQYANGEYWTCNKCGNSFFFTKRQDCH